MTFFEILSKLMNDNNIKAKQLSETLKIGKNQIKYWKDKGNIPNGETLILLANYFDCSIDYLLGLSDTPYKEKHTLAVTQPTDPDEQRQKLLENYDKMNKDGKNELVGLSEIISGNPKYLKADSGDNKIVS